MQRENETKEVVLNGFQSFFFFFFFFFLPPIDECSFQRQVYSIYHENGLSFSLQNGVSNY